MRDFEGANEHSWWALTISARALASELGHRTNYWSRSLSTFGKFNPSIKIDQKFEQKLVIFLLNRFPPNSRQIIDFPKSLIILWQKMMTNLLVSLKRLSDNDNEASSTLERCIWLPRSYARRLSIRFSASKNTAYLLAGDTQRCERSNSLSLEFASTELCFFFKNVTSLK